MDVLVLIKSLFAALKNVLPATKRIRAERRAVRGPVEESIVKIMEDTLIHVGGDTRPNSGQFKILKNILERTIVQTEPFSKPHVRDWLNESQTQTLLMQLALNRLKGEEASMQAWHSLSQRYSDISGEHRSAAADVIMRAVAAIEQGVMACLQDPVGQMIYREQYKSILQKLDCVQLHLSPEQRFKADILRELNARFLRETFSGKTLAKKRLGQPLCPGASASLLSRNELVSALSGYICDKNPDDIIVVTGNEGNGKSWLVAQTWLELASPPFTVFISAEDVGNAEDSIDILARATGRCLPDTDRPEPNVCLKLLDDWRNPEVRPTQRWLVILDGLNQRPDKRWARIIDQINETLSARGGKLVVTTRKRFFDASVKPSLASSHIQLDVPEWSVAERDSILLMHKIDAQSLNTQVAASLCNPRVLSIALRLTNGDQLANLEELSIPRLLFEHIRAIDQNSYEDTALVFTRKLQDHGSEMFHRLTCEQKEDFSVFEGGTGAVEDGRFFIPLTEDATRYSICEDGLSLALGFAIIEQVNKAIRANRSPLDTIAQISEPIAALDIASETLLAALTIACLQHTHSEETAVAVLTGFAGLQNPEAQYLNAFTALARERVSAYYIAYERIALNDMSGVNADWIALALLRVRSDEKARERLFRKMTQWLSYLPPEAAGPKSTDLTTKEHTVYSEVENRLISNVEILATGDVNKLSLLTFQILAGYPLAGFAKHLVQWRFATQIRRDHYAPTKEFSHLIRFNRIDWSQTRENLTFYAESLTTQENSQYGQWAAVSVFMATGLPDDAERVSDTINRLTAGRAPGNSWNIKETFCKTDPCNPDNAEPDNVSATALRYKDSDVNELYSIRQYRNTERVFEKARAGVCRYHPADAISVHRRLIDSLLSRSGEALRLGTFATYEHTALVTLQLAEVLTEKIINPSPSDKMIWESLKGDMFIVKQFLLMMIFPVLDAWSQYQSLLHVGKMQKINLKLLALINPLSPEVFDRVLADAVSCRDLHRQSVVLLFSPYLNAPLTDDITALLPGILDSRSEWVRIMALVLAGRSHNPDALSFVMKWLQTKTSVVLTEHEQSERSWVCLLAIKQGLVKPEQVFSHLTFIHRHKLLGLEHQDAICAHVESVSSLYYRALSTSIATDMQIFYENSVSPLAQSHIFRLEKNAAYENSLEQNLSDEKEDDKSFYASQKRLSNAFENYKMSLRAEGVEDVLCWHHIDDLSRLVDLAPDMAVEWVHATLAKGNEKLPLIRNTALSLACALSHVDVGLSAKLFHKLTRIESVVAVQHTDVAIPHYQHCLWEAADEPDINAIRLHRLKCALDNEAISKEVWAALLSDKALQLHSLIGQLTSSTLPADQARGIMAAAFVSDIKFAEEIFNRFSQSAGLLEETVMAAKDIMQRYKWTLHWYHLMVTANAPEDYWCASVLFMQVVDGRFSVIRYHNTDEGDVFRNYWHATEDLLSKRFKKQSGKRAGRLLTDTPPLECFISG
ncbi:hypothetical protein HV346_17120 [Enterobacter sp. RHBSTW-00994]|uniref:hypothetical protein n=1 Tax=Enterobacter sp. RHBSTW-00994 TaxID=2742676 RepID=UPI0015EA9122|nr:hypothetical protein [Enterobacter sp. RHBSTW-00994]QLR44279.1 hypothetical protein HV346_17120 [Enterobacter sp. RHBSTW-00994]